MMNFIQTLKLEDIFFWEQMEKIAEAIKKMDENEKKDYLWQITLREINDKKTPMREMIRLMLVSPQKAKDIIDNIRIAKMQELKSMSSEITKELQKISESLVA